MKPEFPHFKKLTIDDRSALVDFAQRFPSYTEFNFTYMFAWDLLEPLEYCFLNNNFILKYVDVQTGKNLITILGDEKHEETADTILEYSVAHNMGDTLQNVPELFVAALQGNAKYTITEDRKYHDYMLSVHELAKLDGQKYLSKRNLVHRFSKEHEHHSLTKELDLLDPATHIQIQRVMDEWRLTFEGSAEDIDLEFKAIKKALQHAQQLQLRCFGTYVSGQLESFTIFEIVSRKTMILHFDKATRKYKGLGEHHKHLLSKHVAAEDIELINYQDDMNIEDLRLAKSTYRPVGYLKKYTLSHSPMHKSRKGVHLLTI